MNTDKRGTLTARFPHLRGDLRGGIASALVGLPYSITSAMIAFAPLGTGYIGHGILAGLLATLVAGLVTAVFGGTPCQINGPRASVSVLMAAILIAAQLHPALHGASAPRLLGVALLGLMLAGALQIAFGALRMGGMARFLPYPVISGFMVGVGTLIVLPQVPAMLDVIGPNGWRRLIDAPGAIHPGALLVGAATIAAFLASRKLRPAWPAPLMAMLAGTLLHYVLTGALHVPAGATAWDTVAGHVMPPPPWRVPEFVFDAALPRVLFDLLPAVATLAFVASLESLLSSSVLAIASNMRFDSRRELIGQGLSNIAVGLAGGVVSAGAPFRGVASFGAGGRTRLASAVNALLIGGVGLAAAPLLFGVPLAAWAGTLAVVGYDVASAWGKRLASSPRTEIAVGLVVLLVTLTAGTVPAIVAGIVGSMLLYVHSTSRAPIRGSYDAQARSSLRVRPQSQREVLRQHGAGVRVVELQGAMFFGTADRCGRDIEELARGRTHLILDLRRVADIDMTGALVLMQTVRRIGESGVRVALAGIVPERRRGRVLTAAGMPRVLPVDRWFIDVDSALERAETELLALHWPDPTTVAELELSQMDICAGMRREELDALRPYLRREACDSGTLLFHEGEPGDRMFLLAAGAVTLRVDLRKKDQVRRLATFSRGVTIGEMAVLENKARTADAVCEGETVLLVLDLAALHRMAGEQPALYGRFLMNLARQTAERLRATTLELRAALE